MPAIGRLERVALREVWPYEALDFTRWLEENADSLADVLDFTPTNIERERAAGSFSVDLVAEDDDGRAVVIENQLERSDHDHLGKLITYLTAFDAARAVWIVAQPRPEHVSAIAWLNESSSASFYLVKVEAVRIGISEPAPLLTLIVGPSLESRQVGASKQERAERHDFRQAFWAALLERAKPRTRLHSTISPSTDGWISASTGRSGVHLVYTVRKDDAGVHLYLEGPDAAVNHALFEQLQAHRSEIDAAFGSPLEWDHQEGRKKCSIGVRLHGGGYRSLKKIFPASRTR
jgi:hypothetical protein